MKNSSKEIRLRITDAEKTLVKAIAGVKKAQATLADAFAAGSDAESPMGAVTVARGQVAAIDAALIVLDASWYGALTAERDAAIAAINDAKEGSYKEIAGEIKKALQPALALLRKHLGASADAQATDLVESLTDEIWGKLSEKASTEIISLGPTPIPPAPRTASVVA